jgi:hypothetical protein
MTVRWGDIDGRDITFPMEVTRFNAATVLWSVPAAAARALVPGDAFDVVEVLPGTTQLILAACDYVENPWGDYNELNLGFLARPVGAPDDVVGSFVYRMPVDQAFTCEAGNRVMGFPKTVEVIEVDYTDDRVSFRLESGGVTACTLALPRVGALGPPTRIDTESYSYLDGVPMATPLGMDMATGVVDPGAVRLELGAGPIAEELRSLGLPAAPDLCSWGEDLTATFQLGRPVG